MVGHCVCCGSRELIQTDILWRELSDEWRLSPSEAAYVNRQQGFHCARCGTNLRAMGLAAAIMRASGYHGLFKEFVMTDQAQSLRVLEVNETGALSQYLTQLPHHLLVTYPDVDMMQLPYDEGTWELVVHSDTLEHVPHPVRGLAECARVLVPGGLCAFTVPVIVGRLTQTRAGMPPSYHGNPEMRNMDHVVHTEFGCDVWTYAAQAGFPECRMFSLEYPTTQAWVCVKADAADGR